MADLKTAPVETPSTPEPESEPRKSRRKSLWVAIAILAGFVVYAYGFQVVDVNLDRIGDPVRQGRFANVIRALGSPDIFDYASIDTNVDVDFAMPCPAGTFTPDSPGEGASITVSPTCADPRATVTVTGEGFLPNEPINIFFVPPNGIELRVAQARTDGSGAFTAEAQLPDRPDEAVQLIRAKSKENVGSIFNPVLAPTDEVDPESAALIRAMPEGGVLTSADLAGLPETAVLVNPQGPAAGFLDDGELTMDELREAGLVVRSPRFSQNAESTWRGIIETIFMALLATTLGTLIAMPLSFLAARNLMSDVRIPALNVGLAVVAIPIGAAVGWFAARTGDGLVDSLPQSALLLGVVTVFLFWLGLRMLRFAVPPPEAPKSGRTKTLGALAATAAFLVGAMTLVRFMMLGGSWADSNFGPLSFLGNFVERFGEILALVFGVIAAIAGALAFAILASRFAYGLVKRIGTGTNTILSVIACGLAGAVVAIGVGQLLAWVYQLTNPTTTVIVPGIIGALIGVALGLWGARKGALSSGLGIYYIFRTLFNTLRSIEALILALVFVIWVGLGAFAGTLALALHTVAANAKLYSEQVESIRSGPLEAVRATGATRLQTVVYAVVPQIVAPFIAFTMYRWDINVRMSTIIGFVGGGGIGLVLQQNIQLLNYRGAATQILAIAIVVAAMDYVSSRLRERYV